MPLKRSLTLVLAVACTCLLPGCTARELEQAGDERGARFMREYELCRDVDRAFERSAD